MLDYAYHLRTVGYYSNELLLPSLVENDNTVSVTQHTKTCQLVAKHVLDVLLATEALPSDGATPDILLAGRKVVSLIDEQTVHKHTDLSAINLLHRAIEVALIEKLLGSTDLEYEWIYEKVSQVAYQVISYYLWNRLLVWDDTEHILSQASQVLLCPQTAPPADLIALMAQAIRQWEDSIAPRHEVLIKDLSEILGDYVFPMTLHHGTDFVASKIIKLAYR